MLPAYPNPEPAQPQPVASDHTARKLRLFMLFTVLLGAFFCIAPECDPAFQLFTPEGQRKGFCLFLFFAVMGWLFAEWDVSAREASAKPKKYQRPPEPDPFDTYIHE